MNDSEIIDLHTETASKYLCSAEGPYDLISKDIVRENLSDFNADKSVFNGSSFRNVKFSECSLRHVEFTETLFENVRLYNSYLNSSDVVLSEWDSVVCKGCDFSNGEWREAIFKNIEFERCKFDHTTISLCKFINCTFDKESAKTLTSASTSYNTFSHCTFADNAALHIAFRNFGISNNNNNNNVALSTTGKLDNLVELCLAKTNGTLGSSEVVQRIDQAINEILDSRRKVSSVQLRFIKHIIESLNNINLISPITFLILHDKLLAKNSGKTNSETLFLEYAGILFALRGILYDWETKATKELKKFDNGTYKCLNGTLYLPHHHDLTSATVLANNIFLIAGINLDEVELNVQKGSAYIKFVFKSVVSLASLLTAMNMVLAEVDIGVKNINSIKEGMENLTQSSRQQSPSDIIKRPSQQDRMMQIVTSNKNSALLEKASEITQEQGDTFLDFEGREARLVIEI